MTYKLIKKGKNYIISFNELVFSGIDMRNFIGLELKSDKFRLPVIVIEISSKFELIRYNQTRVLDPKEVETAKIILDLIGLKIKNLECSKTGNLYITFNDGTIINVPDSEYESWYIRSIRQERKKNNWIIGGVGRTTIFDHACPKEKEIEC